MSDSNYLDIENYNIVGNLHTTALISNDLSIDWFCFPRIDSPSIFAKLLDSENGGFFGIDFGFDYMHHQKYKKNTAVLSTQVSKEGKDVAEVIDFMPIYTNDTDSNVLIRVVKALSSCKFRITVDPKLNYARDKAFFDNDDRKIIIKSDKSEVFLTTTERLGWIKMGDELVSDVELNQGEEMAILIGDFEDDADLNYKELLSDTIEYWNEFVSGINEHKKLENRKIITRSAITTKLLTNSQTGGIVAASTTSLPEKIGGNKNWDYRYVWIRDASMTVNSLLLTGNRVDAKKFIDWTLKRIIQNEEDADVASLQIMFGVNGETILEETELEHLEGYKKSKPVRIGNAAFDQYQLDIYGEFINSVFLYYQDEDKIEEELWSNVYKLANHVCINWTKADYGIWEIREKKKHYTHSKLMCWVALDRAIKLAEKFKQSSNPKWIKNRKLLKEYILKDCYSNKLESFTQAADSDLLDSSVLEIFLHDFIDVKHSKALSTMKAVEQKLVKNNLVYRYEGVENEEETFILCSIWLALVYIKLNRFIDAKKTFSNIKKAMNDNGLLSEMIDAKNLKQVGNYPQLFSHVGLVGLSNKIIN